MRIGVFDSGHGGLTILRALAAALPGQGFVYLGDHAGAPYGERDAEDIYARTTAAVETLFAQGCRLVILACNTAAAVALRRLQQAYLPLHHPDRRVLGVLVPMVEAIVGRDWHAPPTPQAGPRSIAIFATPATVRSGAFTREIQYRAPGLRVSEHPCPSLVPLIERDAPDAEIARAVAAETRALLARLAAPPDTAILGCTHYPLIAAHFAASLPAGTAILDQPGLAAASLAAYLARHPEFDETAPAGPRILFHTTGDAARARVLGTRFFGAAAAFEKVECQRWRKAS